jgi:hypothetical protein
VSDLFTNLGWYFQPISKSERNECKELGMARTAWNRENNNAHNASYEGVNFKVFGWQQDAQSVLAEMAVWKYLELSRTDWCDYTENKAATKVPEIGGVAEVRRVTAVNNPLRVYVKDVDEQALMVSTYVHLTPEGNCAEPGVWLRGWADAQDAWDKGMPDYRNYNLRLRNVNRLEEVDTLKNAYKERVSR